MKLTVQFIDTPTGEHFLQFEEDARDVRAQIASMRRQADTLREEGKRLEEEFEGAGRPFFERAANLSLAANEAEHRQDEEDDIRARHASITKTAVFDAQTVTFPLREKLQPVMDADPKDGRKHAEAALELLCPGGVKAISGWAGEVTEELGDVLKARALAAFYRPPSEERRAFLLGSPEA